MPNWLDQDVADGGIRPHEHSNLLLEDVACLVQLIDLVFGQRVLDVLQALDYVKGDLIGPIARRCIQLSVVRRKVLNLSLAEGLLDLLNNFLHVLELLEVLLEVANLDVRTLDQMHLVLVAE